MILGTFGPDRLLLVKSRAEIVRGASAKYLGK
jgi:hypothetical protein